MKQLSLEDARILAQTIAPYVANDIIYQLHPRSTVFSHWNQNGALKLAMTRYWLAVRTIQRHLPAPILHHTFLYHVRIGRLRAAQARFLPYP